MGLILIVGGQLSTGNLTSMFSYHDHSHVAHDVYDDLCHVVDSMASVRRINEVLTTKTTIDSPENGIKEVADGSINFEDVTQPCLCS